MKKLLLLNMLLLTALLTGCGPRPYENRIWEGSLYRTADNEKLSDVSLALSSDTLRVYSNAIFGAGNETLVRQQGRNGAYTFANSRGEEFTMKFEYTKSGSDRETLRIYGPDYTIDLLPAAGSDFTDEMLAFYRKREVPADAALYFSGPWTGEIRRIRDMQKLSKACAVFNGDSLRIYSNAIFSKQNSALVYDGYRNGAFYYIGKELGFILRPQRSNGQLTLTCAGFELILAPCDSLGTEELSFYKGYDVSPHADDYIFGTYEGSSIGRIKNAGMLFAMFGMAPDAMDVRIRMTLTFLEGNRVQMTNESSMVNRDMQMLTMLSGTTGEKETSILKYRVEGNQITIGKGDRLLIRPDGNLYYVGADEKGLTLDPFILSRTK